MKISRLNWLLKSVFSILIVLLALSSCIQTIPLEEETVNIYSEEDSPKNAIKSHIIERQFETRVKSNLKSVSSSCGNGATAFCDKDTYPASNDNNREAYFSVVTDKDECTCFGTTCYKYYITPNVYGRAKGIVGWYRYKTECKYRNFGYRMSVPDVTDVQGTTTIYKMIDEKETGLYKNSVGDVRDLRHTYYAGEAVSDVNITDPSFQAVKGEAFTRGVGVWFGFNCGTGL